MLSCVPSTTNKRICYVVLCHVYLKAVDGNKDPRALIVGNSCFLSVLDSNPWWAVDLGVELAIDRGPYNVEAGKEGGGYWC